MFLINDIFLIKITIQINIINYPGICGDTAGWSQTFLNGGEPTDPHGCLKMFDGLKYHPDALQNTSTLLATSANTAEPKVHAPRWWESWEVEPEPTHYTALNWSFRSSELNPHPQFKCGDWEAKNRRKIMEERQRRPGRKSIACLLSGW